MFKVRHFGSDGKCVGFAYKYVDVSQIFFIVIKCEEKRKIWRKNELKLKHAITPFMPLCACACYEFENI